MHTQALRSSIITTAALVVALSVAAIPVSAHHGWGGYLETTTDVAGTVETTVSLAGPHATLRVKDAEGHVWDVVLEPPAGSSRAGLKTGMIPIGDNVVVHGNRHRDPKKFEIKTTKLTWNGRVFNVYPDRN